VKALTLWRPWVHIIVHRGKRVENRTWKPPQALIGQRIALHHGQKWAPPNKWSLPGDIDRTDPEVSALGIIATAILAGVVEVTATGDELIMGTIPGGWTEENHERWFHGPYGWILDDVRPVGPFACPGAQGLWNVHPLLEDAVKDAI
jgi:hypothetical protein